MELLMVVMLVNCKVVLKVARWLNTRKKERRRKTVKLGWKILSFEHYTNHPSLSMGFGKTLFFSVVDNQTPRLKNGSFLILQY
jgi:hypothetical protein